MAAELTNSDKVYLHELDSVRTSEPEMAEGQKALYHAIADEGKRVVLTFNQLIDSPAFLCALWDESSFKSLMNLIELGRILISSYTTGTGELVETPAQYLLNSLEKNTEPGIERYRSVFVHSALPIQVIPDNEGVFDALIRAVKYSDPHLIDTFIRNSDVYVKTDGKPNKTTEAEKNDIALFLERYVRLIIGMSTSDNAHSGCFEGDYPKLRDLLAIVTSHGKKSEGGITGFKEACIYLDDLWSEEVPKLDTYGSWEKQVIDDKKRSLNSDGDDLPSQECLDFALSIIQLCNIYGGGEDTATIVSKACEYKASRSSGTATTDLTKVLSDTIRPVIEDAVCDVAEPNFRGTIASVLENYKKICTNAEPHVPDSTLESVEKAGKYLDRLFKEEKELYGQDRSSWELKIEEDAQSLSPSAGKEKFKIAESIVDICYIYTCEFSIRGFEELPYWPEYESTGWSDPKDVFFDRVVMEVGEYLKSNHVFLKVDKGGCVPQVTTSLPDWNRASRIVTRVDNRSNSKRTTRILTLIVVGLITVVMSWDTMTGNLWKLVLGATIVLVTFVAGCCLNESSVLETIKMLLPSIWDFLKKIWFTLLSIIAPFVLILILGVVSEQLYKYIYFSKCRTMCAYLASVLIILISSYQYDYARNDQKNKWLSVLRIVSIRAALASFYYIIMLFVIDKLDNPLEEFADSHLTWINALFGSSSSNALVASVPALLAFLFMNIVNLEAWLHVPDFDDAYGQLRSSIMDYYSVKKARNADKTSK